MAQKLHLFFQGQSSQSVGMLSELLEQSDVVKATFAEASEALGYDLAALVLNGPEQELNQTHRTQPALLTAISCNLPPMACCKSRCRCNDGRS